MQSKISDLIIIHENLKFYNAVFAKVKYKLVDLKNSSSIFRYTLNIKQSASLMGGGPEMNCA